jgi:hypothetical protein
MRALILVLIALLCAPQLWASGVGGDDAGTTIPLVIVYPPVVSGVSEDEVSNVLNEVWAHIGRAGCLAIHAEGKPEAIELDRLSPFDEMMRRGAAGWVVISLHSTNDALKDSAAVHVWNRRLQGIDLGSGGTSSVDAKTSYSLRLRTLLLDLRKDARLKAHIQAGIARLNPKPYLVAGEKDPLDLSLLLHRRIETVRVLSDTKYTQLGAYWPVAITNAERDSARSGAARAIADFETWFASTKLRPDPTWSKDAPIEEQLERFESMLTGLVILRAQNEQPDAMAELLAAHRRIIVAREIEGAESMRIDLQRAGPRAAAFQNALLKAQRNRTNPTP